MSPASTIGFGGSRRDFSARLAARSEIGDFGADEAVFDGVNILDGVGTLSVSSDIAGIESTFCFGGSGSGVGVGVGIAGDSINVHCNETISESCPRSVCNTILSRYAKYDNSFFIGNFTVNTLIVAPAYFKSKLRSENNNMHMKLTGIVCNQNQSTAVANCNDILIVW